MRLCECGQEEITIPVAYLKESYNVRPVRIHLEDFKELRESSSALFLDKRKGQDYVKKVDGTKFGINVARKIIGLVEGHQGMKVGEDIVKYKDGNTLNLRRCNLEITLLGE